MSKERAFTVTAPCDLYGRNAHKLSCALNAHGGFVTIEKPGENRACPANSLIGLLSLGIRKGDTIQFVTRDGADESAHILNALSEIAV